MPLISSQAKQNKKIFASKTAYVYGGKIHSSFLAIVLLEPAKKMIEENGLTKRFACVRRKNQFSCVRRKNQNAGARQKAHSACKTRSLFFMQFNPYPGTPDLYSTITENK